MTGRRHVSALPSYWKETPWARGAASPLLCDPRTRQDVSLFIKETWSWAAPSQPPSRWVQGCGSGETPEGPPRPGCITSAVHRPTQLSHENVTLRKECGLGGREARLSSGERDVSGSAESCRSLNTQA